MQREPQYPDKLATGTDAFRVDYSYNVTTGTFGSGGFSRTTAKALLPAIRASRINLTPRHLKLGGRNVVKFRIGSTATQWAFTGPGGWYVFSSHDYYGPSELERSES